MLTDIYCFCQGKNLNPEIQASSTASLFSITAAAAAAKSLQSCLTLCDPIDGSPPGSPVLGILQARILEWVAISFSSLASILKSRDITLLTKVHPVKAMFLPVVMYGCESWTIKKAER